LFGAETLIAFDILRIENGKAAEHWDNLQVPPTQTASGRSMTDGSVEIVDFEKTEENKAFVERFWTEVFVLGLVEKLAEFISSEPGAFIQHDPLITDGIDGLAEALKTFAENGKLYSYTKIHKILGEGNFVFSMSEGKIGEVPSAFFDLVRVENGKIVEHWNTVMEIPNQWAHENGSNIFTNLITDYWFRFNSCMNGHSVKF
jgi:predicted SnoaL-like aldol condensation-catalyzing enzyme